MHGWKGEGDLAVWVFMWMDRSAACLLFWLVLAVAERKPRVILQAGVGEDLPGAMGFVIFEPGTVGLQGTPSELVFYEHLSSCFQTPSLSPLISRPQVHQRGGTRRCKCLLTLVLGFLAALTI